MRALSLTQPWATLVAVGAKRLETRSWATPYRGLLAIHASAGYPKWAKAFREEALFREALDYAGYTRYHTLPTGAVLAIVHLVNCIPTERVTGLSETEEAFGDFGPGRYAWELVVVRRLPEPIPAKGALSLWERTPPVGVLEGVGLE